MNDLDRFLGVSLAALLATGCALTSHAVQPSGLGAVGSGAELEAAIDQPGSLTVETVSSTEWAVDRGGLINLESPKAKAAGLTEGDEPIEVYFHAIRHPTKGLFIIDTGVEVAMRDRPDEAALMQSAVVKKYLHPEKMKFTAPLGEWLRSKGEPLAGVLFTHLHTDHLSGLRDVPKGTPLYNGPGEAHERALVNFFLSDVVDSAFEGQAPLSEWQFAADPSGQFAGVIDVFGDGSLWAISVPGHTAGSTAYVARTAQGPVLFTGDTCHTRWGWENGVEPGGFTADHGRNLESLEKLRARRASPGDAGAAGSPGARAQRQRCARGRSLVCPGRLPRLLERQLGATRPAGLPGPGGSRGGGLHLVREQDEVPRVVVGPQPGE